MAVNVHTWPCMHIDTHRHTHTHTHTHISNRLCIGTTWRGEDHYQETLVHFLATQNILWRAALCDIHHQIMWCHITSPDYTHMDIIITLYITRSHITRSHITRSHIIQTVYTPTHVTPPHPHMCRSHTIVVLISNDKHICVDVAVSLAGFVRLTHMPAERNNISESLTTGLSLSC